MKIFRSLTFLSITTGFLLTIILWYIQMWTVPTLSIPYPFDKNPFLLNIYKEALWPFKIQLAFVVGALLLFIQLFIGLYPKFDRNRRWIKSVIDHIISEKFHGDLEHTRITVFRVRKGYTIFFSYLWKCFVWNLVKHYKKNVIISHIKLIPNPFKDYLVMYTRRSHPHEKGTSTFFPVASSPQEVCGIASHSLYIGAPSKVDVDSISNIPIKEFKKLDDIKNDKIKKRIGDYMDSNKINSFDALKCIHRLSNHVWANPIYDKDENSWGVIVVDNESDTPLLFSSIEQDLVSYTRIITLSIIHLN